MSIERPEGEELIRSVELAHEMAKVEAPHQERLKLAREIGLGPEALQKLGVEKDDKVERARRLYEKAMAKAEDMITQALLKGESKISVTDLVDQELIGAKDMKDITGDELSHKLYEALLYRLYRPRRGTQKGVEPVLEPKTDYQVSLENNKIKIER